ncbi:MAG: adenosylcobinamide-phosphate synthase CbiB [Microcoleaceae cyanobacterium]
MTSNRSLIVLGIALVLDYSIGDPQKWLHPVQVMGWHIQFLTRLSFQHLKTPKTLKVAGILLALLLIFGSGGVSWGIIFAVRFIPGEFPLHPVLGMMTESLLLASCFAGRSLRHAAENVLQYLTQKDLVTARQQLSRYVGRDTDSLSESEILRAMLETITENAIDGMMAPLFYAMIGLAIPGIGSVPLAFAYKAASTLDSMVGYKEAPYTDLGWFSAKLEDGLTWIPCRLTVITVAVLSGKPKAVWQLCQRDAIHDPSPNSGWSECVYAAALGVQLGGANLYKGVVKSKPLLGDRTRAITQEVIAQALQLTRNSIFLWFGIVTLAYGLRLLTV